MSIDNFQPDQANNQILTPEEIAQIESQFERTENYEISIVYRELDGHTIPTLTIKTEVTDLPTTYMKEQAAIFLPMIAGASDLDPRILVPRDIDHEVLANFAGKLIVVIDHRSIEEVSNTRVLQAALFGREGSAIIKALNSRGSIVRIAQIHKKKLPALVNGLATISKKLTKRQSLALPSVDKDHLTEEEFNALVLEALTKMNETPNADLLLDDLES